MTDVYSIKQLESVLKDKIRKSLDNEVAKEIKRVQQIKLRDVVYRYVPEEYERRGMHGGLLDPDNTIGYKAGLPKNAYRANRTERLIVENVTPFNTTKVEYGGRARWQLTPLIVKGHWSHHYGYSWYPHPKDRSDQYARPRPFVYETYKKVKSANLHTQALQTGLKKQGLHIKW